MRTNDLRAGRVLRGEYGGGAEWHALWDGRWTLIDAFHRNGKRWLVAHRNTTREPGPDALLPSEREVVTGAAEGRSLKLMAYELGLPAGTVATILARGMRKLRVTTRADLAALVIPLLEAAP